MEISKNSRVWIYQSDKRFSDEQVAEIQNMLTDFTSQWLAHGKDLYAKAEIRYNRFIILMVDESVAEATGCSIDKSVALMKAIEARFSVNLFDRFNIAYHEADEVVSCDRAEFERLLSDGIISDETIVFNNLVQTVGELETNWEIPLKDSWHAQVFSLK
ncbi:ABC transporter ATPase [Pedobacter sp. BS3]|uniref:ABC transporter ATPase n=1 Tax=Pedobacter sp. BS3 TaxID=2567937 RepID=UPI0011ED454F|nr:ABC transporter ATPase [Pedobacter sp. BS3]TZF82189.1 ABC transporter ATPase [Pedobacter sp. BS3]